MVRLCRGLFRKHAQFTFPCSRELNLEGFLLRIIPGYMPPVEPPGLFFLENQFGNKTIENDLPLRSLLVQAKRHIGMNMSLK